MSTCPSFVKSPVTINVYCFPDAVVNMSPDAIVSVAVSSMVVSSVFLSTVYVSCNFYFTFTSNCVFVVVYFIF